MRILVAGGIDPTVQFAHVINTVKMAEGFAKLGHEVYLACLAPADGTASSRDIEASFGICKPIKWIFLERSEGACMAEEHWRFALETLPHLFELKPDLVFARDYVLPGLASKAGIPSMVECHAHIGNQGRPFLTLVETTRHKHFLKWITIADCLKDYYHSLGVPEDKIIVLPDAVDTRIFMRPAQLPSSPYQGKKPNAVYVGHLYDYKGIPTVLSAAKLLPDVNFHLIGGIPEDIERQKEKASNLGVLNLVFHGALPHSSLAPYLWHADALLLPPSKDHPSARWTSPMKLGEYMASGVPIVASDIEALKSWLSGEDAFFFEADKPDSLAKALRQVLSDTEAAARCAEKTLARVKDFSCEARARRILA
ncbi:MAG: hypothetical protein A2X49_00595 [Lentisphaerae bacterium GWF2_52_8]|nr:MAG: hypothetical protein A2X49_00595 [Lentisphaerae bacterium GWF2_52_8]